MICMVGRMNEEEEEEKGNTHLPKDEPHRVSLRLFFHLHKFGRYNNSRVKNKNKT